MLNDRRAVPPLIRALLQDDNPHRRHAAAREEAAESLAYVGTRQTIAPLVSVLRDPDVRIRFWAVFGLGGSSHGDVRAIRALESVLDDNGTPPGNWWPVGKEALAMLASEPRSAADYKPKLSDERQRILADANATAEDLRWAAWYR